MAKAGFHQAHDAAVTKLSWAHPEFGTILASSSFDRTVKVWEQTSYSDTDAQTNGASGSSTASRWVERAVLVDAKGTVRAVEFAPHQFGLKMVRTPRELFGNHILRVSLGVDASFVGYYFF
jgi:nucleoporin SEH1